MDSIEMNARLLEDLRTIAADVFRLPRSQISETSTPAQIASWDSLQHVNLVLALEQQFCVEFDPAEIGRRGSIGKIVDVLSRKLNDNI